MRSLKIEINNQETKGRNTHFEFLIHKDYIYISYTYIYNG